MFQNVASHFEKSSSECSSPSESSVGRDFLLYATSQRLITARALTMCEDRDMAFVIPVIDNKHDIGNYGGRTTTMTDGDAVDR